MACPRSYADANMFSRLFMLMVWMSTRILEAESLATVSVKMASKSWTCALKRGIQRIGAAFLPSSDAEQSSDTAPICRLVRLLFTSPAENATIHVSYENEAESSCSGDKKVTEP